MKLQANVQTSLQLTNRSNHRRGGSSHFYRTMNTFQVSHKLRLSRTVLCISIRRSNGHRTAKRVKNTGQSTGICGHTGQTTLQSHMRLFTIGFDRGTSPSVAEVASVDNLAESRALVKSCVRADLRRMPQSMSDTVASVRRAARRLRGDCRVLRPLFPLYPHCGLQRALSTPSPGGVFARKLHTADTT